MSVDDKKRLVLVLGGTRSGKSDVALQFTEDHFDAPLFLATARILDEEMSERVRLHQAARGPHWRLLEEPIAISEALETKCEGFDAVLIDCLTVWLGNILIEKGEAQVQLCEDQLLETLSKRALAVVLVSNEVGMGIVPDNPVGRAFRDFSGRLNQRLARLADTVIFTVAGIPTYIKGKP